MTEKLGEISDRRPTAEGSANNLCKGRPPIQPGEKHLKNQKQKDQRTRQKYKTCYNSGHLMQGKPPSSPAYPSSCATILRPKAATDLRVMTAAS